MKPLTRLPVGLLWTVLALALVACGTAGAGGAPAMGYPSAGSDVAPSPATVAGDSPAAEPLVVLAASDLQFALPDIAARYQEATGRRVTVALGSTGTFATQIENGAPADLFFAADRSFVDRLERRGLIVEGSRRIYAIGRLAIAPAPNAAFPPSSIEDLARPELKKIAIANPEHAPYGRAARQAIDARGLGSQLEPKLVLAENIAQAFQFVQTGNADAGIVALSVVLGVPGAPYTLIDPSLHGPLTQEAAVVKGSRQPAAAEDFLAFVTGPTGRPILERYGFGLPDEP